MEKKQESNCDNGEMTKNKLKTIIENYEKDLEVSKGF